MNDPLRLLLIDDNPTDRLLVIRELRREFTDVQVEEIIEAKGFNRALKAGGFDLVITDYQLHWTTGLEILDAVKAHWPDCPVIMFTGTGSEEIATKAMKAGLEDYILKSPKHYVHIPTAIQSAMEKAWHRQALKEAEARYQSLFDGVPVGLYRTTPGGRIVDANPAMVEMLGYPDQRHLFSINAADLYVNPEERKWWQAMIESQGVVRDFETQLSRCDGAIIWVRISARVIRDDNGRVCYYEGSMADITDRKQAEEEIRQLNLSLERRVAERTAELKTANEQLQGEITTRKQAEEALAAEKERLGVTLRSIGDGVIATDTKGEIVLINQVAENLTGWAQGEAMGKPLTEVFHIINEKTREHCENPIAKVIKTGKIVSLADRTVLIAEDGTERLVDDSAAPIHDKEGNIIGVVLVFRDITEKQKMEEHLQRTQKLESIGILAGGIAHDFNNILSIIWGNIDLARMYSKSEDKVLERLAKSEKGCLRAKDLTQQLLTFARGGAPIKQPVAVSKLLKDTVELALSGARARCEISLPDDLWLGVIDEVQISQVINNMIINAGEAQPSGGIIKVRAENVSVTAEDVLPLQAGKYVKISIEDQGIGIPEENLPKIFDLYFSTKEDGDGLGLATAWSIIKKHDGCIEVKSEVGVGTTFDIYLPASDEKLIIKEEEKAEIFRGEGKILLMDDEEDVREATGWLLKGLGYEVEFAGDGAEAVDLYNEARKVGRPFGGVILDLTIPGGMGGKETMQKLVEIDPEVKVIVSSGYSNDPIMADFEEYGFSGVAAKPYDIRKLSEVLYNVIGSQMRGADPTSDCY
ncbi:MAG: PAS domain S-box protein [bacterium]|nr:PAS domain S-box protein [bacterium]